MLIAPGIESRATKINLRVRFPPGKTIYPRCLSAVAIVSRNFVRLPRDIFQEKTVISPHLPPAKRSETRRKSPTSRDSAARHRYPRCFYDVAHATRRRLCEFNGEESRLIRLAKVTRVSAGIYFPRLPFSRPSIFSVPQLFSRSPLEKKQSSSCFASTFSLFPLHIFGINRRARRYLIQMELDNQGRLTKGRHTWKCTVSVTRLSQQRIPTYFDWFETRELVWTTDSEVAREGARAVTTKHADCVALASVLNTNAGGRRSSQWHPSR